MALTSYGINMHRYAPVFLAEPTSSAARLKIFPRWVTSRFVNSIVGTKCVTISSGALLAITSSGALLNVTRGNVTRIVGLDS